MGMCEKHNKKKPFHIPRNVLSAPVSQLLHGRSVRKGLAMPAGCRAGEMLEEGDGASRGLASPHTHKHLKQISLNRDALISVQKLNLGGCRPQSAHQHSPSEMGGVVSVLAESK